MPSFKSDAWREIILVCEAWRQEACTHVDDDLGAWPIDKLGVNADKIVGFCDQEGVSQLVDPSPLLRLSNKIRHHHPMTKVFGDGPRVGREPSQDDLEDMMVECVGVLDRLQALGTMETPEKPTDLITFKEVLSLVSVSEGTLRRRKKDWPASVVKPRGSRAEKWSYAALLPCLKKLWPKKDFPSEWPVQS